MTTFLSELCFLASINARCWAVFQEYKGCHVALELTSIRCQALKVHLCCRQRCDCIMCNSIHFSQRPWQPLPTPPSLTCPISSFSSRRVPRCSSCSVEADPCWQRGGRMRRPNLASVAGGFFDSCPSPCDVWGKALSIWALHLWVVLYALKKLIFDGLPCVLLTVILYCSVKTHPWALWLCRNKFFQRFVHFSSAFRI